MTLEVLICTFNDRMRQVPQVLLPMQKGVSYCVSFQYSDERFLPLCELPALRRPDVRVTTVRGRGLSANRNHALLEATADVLLLADDDVRYQPEHFARILRHFEDDAKLDVACFQAETTDGRPLSPYPTFSFAYEEQPRGTYYRSIELAMRRSPRLPRFDERFGLGSAFLACGEEEVFLFQASRQGLSIRFFPETIVQTTNAATTGSRFFSDAAVQRSKGAVLTLIHGRTGALLRCFKFAFTNARKSNPFSTLWQMVRGIIYVQQ